MEEARLTVFRCFWFLFDGFDDQVSTLNELQFDLMLGIGSRWRLPCIVFKTLEIGSWPCPDRGILGDIEHSDFRGDVEPMLKLLPQHFYRVLIQQVI